jgi:hypothetical protein
MSPRDSQPQALANNLYLTRAQPTVSFAHIHAYTSRSASESYPPEGMQFRSAEGPCDGHIAGSRRDNNVIDKTQRRMRQCAVKSPAFIASLVDAIDTEREIAEIEPDPGPSMQWWDKLDWYHRGRQRRDDRRPADPGEYFLAGYLQRPETPGMETPARPLATSQRPPYPRCVEAWPQICCYWRGFSAASRS